MSNKTPLASRIILLPRKTKISNLVKKIFILLAGVYFCLKVRKYRDILQGVPEVAMPTSFFTVCR